MVKAKLADSEFHKEKAEAELRYASSVMVSASIDVHNWVCVYVFLLYFIELSNKRKKRKAGQEYLVLARNKIFLCYNYMICVS